MEGSSKVIVGGVAIMVVTLAIVLALVLVLVAELYCSFFLRRRSRQPPSLPRSPLTKNDYASHSQGDSRRSLFQLLQEDSTTPSSLASFYEQGVLSAPAPPRTFLFTSFHNNDRTVNLHKPQHQLPPFSPPKLVSGEVCGGCSSNSNNSAAADNFIYICNPIYDNSIAGVEATPPFGTPDSSPSRLEEVGSSGEEDGGDVVYSCPCESGSHIMTPPLTPMKNLLAEAASVSLREVGSLATTTGSGSISSSHSSASPCNSLSW